MSNALAIAAATATLRNLIFRGVNAGLAGTDVTTRPPDRARHNLSGNQLNLFLYQTTPDAALRNTDMAGVNLGETGMPPLPLVLHYLLTAYAANDDETVSHHLLGLAMRILHDRPLLVAKEIQDALAGNDLYLQVERVRITLQPLSLEEMSKLWTTFQTQYRISAAYEVSVVLIDSTRVARTPLPVLTRGPDDRGPVAQGDVVSPFPTLTAVKTADEKRPSALLTDQITISGTHLEASKVGVRLTHPRLVDPIDIPAPLIVSATGSEIEFRLPQPPTVLPAGFYSVAVVFPQPDKSERTTNELFFALAPEITTGLPITVARDGVGTATVKLQCVPQVLPEQQVFLLLGDRQVPAADHQAATTSLTFPIVAAPKGKFLIRLRVDGVDSMVVNWGATPPVFLNHRIEIT